MSKNRIKLFIWLGLLFITLALVVGVLAWLGRIVVYFNTGADRSTALNIVPSVPPDLAERVTWLPDHMDTRAGRVMDPRTRDQVAGSYISAWAQLNISHEINRPYGLKTYFSGQALKQAEAAVAAVGAQATDLTQTNLHHTLQLTFYSDNGSVATFTDHDAHFVRFLPGADRVLETRSAYDVLMLLEEGNWRVRYLVRRGDATAADEAEEESESNTGLPVGATFIKADGPFLWRGGEKYTAAGVNYYPRATPWDAFWESYDPARTKTDLAVMRALGLNTVRIFVPFTEFGGGEVDPEMLELLVDFLDQARDANVAVIVTLFDHRTDHHPHNWAADDRHIAGIVPVLAEHPALLAWDLKNEPDRDFELNGEPLTEAWLRHIAERVRAHDPNHLITIGWFAPEAATMLAETVDIVSYHFYAPADEYSARVGALRDAIGDKPLLLEEFGLPTWNSIFPHGHNEAEQAQYYAEILAYHRALDTAGYLAWTLYDFINIPFGEFLMPWQRGPQAHMGLIDRDYRFKPAAALMHPQARLDVPPIAGWKRFVKPFWLMLYVFAFVGLLILLVAHHFWRKSRKVNA